MKRPETIAHQLAQLEQAIHRYLGDFMAGFSLSDAPEFDAWMSVQRETYHRRYQLVCDRLPQWQLEGGDVTGAIETASRWVAHAPLNEAVHRRLIQSYLANGDRASALSAYTACRAALECELNAEPASETQALAERIRTQSTSPSADVVGKRDPITAFAGPLVGRTAEYTALVTTYKDAQRGELKIALLEGEPGIGNTRLAHDFLGWARAQGTDTLRGQRAARTNRTRECPRRSVERRVAG